MFKVKLGSLYKCIVLLILVCAYIHIADMIIDKTFPVWFQWSDFDLDLWSSSNVVGAVTTFSLGLMLIKVKVTGEIIQLATLLHYFNTLWLCHQQLASLLPLNFKVAFSYNKPFIIKIFLFGFTQAFEIFFYFRGGSSGRTYNNKPIKWMRDNIKQAEKWTES